MKFLFFLAMVVAAASASYLPEEGSSVPQKIADKEFLVRQKNLLRLLNHVNMPNTHHDLAQVGKEYRIENNIEKYTNVHAVKDLIRIYKSGMLPKGKIFSIMYERQREEVIALFHVLYYARDWDTFFRTACWARDSINEGMFVYALTVAVLHRPDCRGMILPPPYEIYPNYFINGEVIQKAYRVKMQERIIDPKLADFYGIHKIDNTFLINSNYSGWYMRINEEQKLTYFTEDIGLNSYYYYFHTDYPFWMGGDEFGLKKDRRGEMYYYVHQQLLARYYLERLSNDLGEIPRFSWTQPIKTGFTSSLKYNNGLDFPSRPNHFDLNTEENIWDLIEVKDLERRIRDAVKSGYVITEEGVHLSLRKHEDIEVLGRLMQLNEDSPNKRYYYYVSMVAKSLLGNSVDPLTPYFTAPSALEHFETALRDPMFFQLYKRLMHYFLQFKNQLPAYTHEEVDFNGVKIEDVTVDKLVTYFDNFDVDITNALYRHGDEMDQNKDRFVFKARQHRLNHTPFNVKLEINSEKATDAVVRIFLGPKYDGMGRKISINENGINFFKLDQVLLTLKSGKNVITRNSAEFMMNVKDRTPTRELLQHIESAISGNEQFVLDMSEAHNGFPSRLVLPKGKKGGMEFQLYVIVSPHRQPKLPIGTGFDKVISSGVGTGARYVDGAPLGYPFDRKINERAFITPNMYMKDVVIYHKDHIDLLNTVAVARDIYNPDSVSNVESFGGSVSGHNSWSEDNESKYRKY